MQRPWLILTFLVVVVSPQMAASSSFVLKDSGFQASSQHRIYWLDNNRVIFTGYEINLDKIDKQGRYGREQNIYIWDTRSLSDIDRPPLAENLQMGYQLFYPTHAMEAP